MTCGKCRLLRVLPDADGRVRIRKSRSYLCTAAVENPRLPKSVRKYDPPRPSFMGPGEGEGCSYFEERSSSIFSREGKSHETKQADRTTAGAGG